MGTTYSVKVVLDGERNLAANRLKAIADEEFLGVNQQMSTYINNSELSLWNQHGNGDWQSVSAELFDVLQLSNTISVKSGGAFDVTVMPLVNLWGFGPDGEKAIPTEEQIAVAKSQVGYQQIELDSKQRRLRKPAQVHVDLSAVAKGFGADQLARRLAREGFAHFMVEVGGELAVKGYSRRGTPWRIGIETPSYSLLRAPEGPAAAVDLSDAGMATSGDYRNYYEVDGVRVSHTIDPLTGAPITHGLASVSVIAKTCAEADAWATALNVIGPDKALALAEREGLAVYLIIRDGDDFVTKVSTAFKPYLVD